MKGSAITGPVAKECVRTMIVILSLFSPITRLISGLVSHQTLVLWYKGLAIPFLLHFVSTNHEYDLIPNRSTPLEPACTCQLRSSAYSTSLSLSFAFSFGLILTPSSLGLRVRCVCGAGFAVEETEGGVRDLEATMTRCAGVDTMGAGFLGNDGCRWSGSGGGGFTGSDGWGAGSDEAVDFSEEVVSAVDDLGLLLSIWRSFASIIAILSRVFLPAVSLTIQSHTRSRTYFS